MLKRLCWGVVVMLILTACSSKDDQIQKTLEQELKASKVALKYLGRSLDYDVIQNAVKLKRYAKLLKLERADIIALIDEIAKDATRLGPLYLGLQKRVGYAENQADFPDWQTRLQELKSLRQALSPYRFGDALSDSINVLADLSGGKLPRVAAMQKSTELKTNHAKDYGAGSQYIGNPSYGHWQSGGINGTSVWAWYGMYSAFSSLTRPTYYGDWSSNRGYSYYSDYGHSRYTSPQQRSAQATVQTRTKKSFDRQGKNFSSPYAQRKTGSSSLSLASQTPSSRSSYANANSRYGTASRSRYAASSNGKSSYASQQSSQRSSYSSSRTGSSRTSRSYSGGK